MTATTSVDAELAWFADIAPTLPWKWSRTMAHNFPHSYVIKDKTVSVEDHDRIFRLIMAHGEPAKFFNRVNIELVLPDLSMAVGPQRDRTTHTGFKFWPMTDKLRRSTVINTAPAHLFYGVQDAPSTRPLDGIPGTARLYDHLAGEYDERYTHPEDLAENAQIYRHVVADRFIPSLLDVGAGTGLALDMGFVRKNPDSYRAIEPSQGMLNRLVFKHGWVKDIVPTTAEDYFENHADSRTFDTTISLFGAASYLPPSVLPLLLDATSHTLCLMHYEEGYLPDYWNNRRPDPDYADASREAAAALPHAEVTHLNHFQVVTVEKQ